MKTSEKFTKVLTAMAEIQEFMLVEPDGENNITKSAKVKYATLDNILKTVKPHLKGVGLVLVQDTDAKEKSITCSTTVCHAESGEWIRASSTVPIERSSAQGVGSSTTYGRRYSLCTALGIGMNNDDDGNIAEKALSKAEEKRAAENDLLKYQAATLPRLLKYDITAVEEAFAENGYYSELEDAERMVAELTKQVNSKEKLTTIGRRIKDLHEQIQESKK